MQQLKDFFSLLGMKKFFFFLLFGFCLTSGVFYFFSFFPAVVLCLAAVLLWKTFLGLSWFNFAFLCFAVLETNILAQFVKTGWVFVFILFFLALLFQKIFAGEAKEHGQPDKSRYWHEILFYYLLLFWIIASYGIYFFLNYPFWVGLLVYVSGLALFIYFYLLYADIALAKFLPPFLSLVLINLELFLLLSCFSLNTLILGILNLLVFRGVVYFFQYGGKDFLQLFAFRSGKIAQH